MHYFVEKHRKSRICLFHRENRAGKKRQEIIVESMEKQGADFV